VIDLSLLLFFPFLAPANKPIISMLVLTKDELLQFHGKMGRCLGRRLNDEFCKFDLSGGTARHGSNHNGIVISSADLVLHCSSYFSAVKLLQSLFM
jgi:hypothetical protein